MVARLAPLPLRDRLRWPALLLLLVLGTGAVILSQWAMAPRSGSADIRASGLLRDIDPTENAYGIPEAHLKVELPSGLVVAPNIEVRRLGRCRLGGRIDLVGGRTNAGPVRWRVAPIPCP